MAENSEQEPVPLERGEQCEDCGLDYRSFFLACPYCSYGEHARLAKQRSQAEVMARAREEKDPAEEARKLKETIEIVERFKHD